MFIAIFRFNCMTVDLVLDPCDIFCLRPLCNIFIGWLYFSQFFNKANSITLTEGLLQAMGN